jgi:hypothetical protein
LNSPENSLIARDRFLHLPNDGCEVARDSRLNHLMCQLDFV